MSKKSKSEGYLLVLTSGDTVTYVLMDKANWGMIDPEDPIRSYEEIEPIQEFEQVSDLFRWCSSTGVEIADELCSEA